jgi:hypothetical protein
MLLSPPGTDGIVASRDMEVVLPINDSVGGWVVVHPPVVHHTDNNQCGNQTTYQKLHASSGALGPKALLCRPPGPTMWHMPPMLLFLHELLIPYSLYTARLSMVLQYTLFSTVPTMPADFFREHPFAERYIWVEFFRYTGWEVDELLAAPMGIVLDIVETIHLEVQASSLEQAQEWANDCQHYAEIKG